MATTSEVLDIAIKHHQSGELREAERIYWEILTNQPDHPDALHLLGVLLYQLGKHERAIESICRALVSKPDSVVYLANLGAVYEAAGKLDDAVASCRRAVQNKPNYVKAYNNLGIALRAQGKLDEAVASCQRALRLKPDYPQAHNNLGAAYQAQGKLDQAIASYQRALAIKPDYLEAHNNLGAALQERGELDQAVASHQRALHIDPDCAEAHNNLANALKAQKKLDEAVVSYQRALQLDPDYADAHANLGNALLEQGRLDEAAASYETAMQLGPHDGLKIRVALLMPIIIKSADEMHRQRDRIQENVSRLLRDNLSVDEAEHKSGLPVFYLAYQGMNDRDLQRDIAEIYAKATSADPYVAPHCLTLSDADVSRRRIRVGFISKFLCSHTIGKLNAGIIRNLSREKFQVTVLRFPDPEDELGQSVQQSADIVVTLSPRLESARRQIAQQQLDVLFYTDIGMEPNTYSLAFSRLAPVQCVTWGHPVTTGIPTIDYFISGEDLEPTDGDEHYTEKLVRLTTLGVYYYRPQLADPPKSRADFGRPEDKHLYACPQSLFKFHPDFDEILSDILRRDRQSLLVLLSGTHSNWNRLLLERFAKTMPDVMHRVRFLPRQRHVDFLRLNALVDVLLDPLHFGGGNTSYEALWLGTPIVTLPSQFLRGRITYALYRKMGVLDCVVETPQQYIDLAVRLGTDPDYRASVRDKILTAVDLLYEDTEAVRELETFFMHAIEGKKEPVGRTIDSSVLRP